MFELAKFLLPPRRKNDYYHKDAWYSRYMHYKEEIIHKSTKQGLPTEIQEELDARDIYFRGIPP